MNLGHNINHIFYFITIYSLGLSTGLVIAFNKALKNNERTNKESLDRLQEVINSWKKRDYDNRL